MSLATVAAIVAACGGGGSPAEPTTVTTPVTVAPPAPVASGYTIETREEAYDFLARATFGADMGMLDAMVGQSAPDFMSAEFAKPADYRLEDLVARRAGGENMFAATEGAYWDKFLNGDDQLRQRTVWALHQIVVKSRTLNEDFRRNVQIMDVYNRHAFGNYAELLEAITYTPGMADFLTYRNSRKADTRSGSMPDENYAREIMQLFSIGLVELNMDGTPKLGADGNPVETYTNEDVQGLARVFTGFTGAPEGASYTPMGFNPRHHEDGEKTFLGHTIPAGTSGADSVRDATQVLVDHPNTPPFISRQLIQRFTQSAPSSQYVERVATAFANGTFTAEDGTSFGDGRRGSLEATMAAVLLDAQFFDERSSTGEEVKIREPLLRIAHMLRAFEFNDPDPDRSRYRFSLIPRDQLIGQGPTAAPSVFGDYRPGFISKNSETGNAGLTAPELQLQTEATIRGYADGVTAFIFQGSENRFDPTEPFYPVFSDELALEADADALVDRIDAVLTNGRLSPMTRQRIVDGLVEMPVREREDLRDRDRLARVRFAIWMVATSTDFAIAK